MVLKQNLLVVFQMFFKGIDLLTENRIGLQCFSDAFDGVNYGGMIPSAKMQPDSYQRMTGQLFRQVHSRLPGAYHIFAPGFCPQLIIGNIEEFRGMFHNRFNGQNGTIRLGNFGNNGTKTLV